MRISDVATHRLAQVPTKDTFEDRLDREKRIANIVYAIISLTLTFAMLIGAKFLIW